MKTSRLAANSILAAACTILGYFALDLGNIKISFEALPIFIAACLFGAYDAALVSLVGTGLYQLLRYGITVTTPLWILPYFAAAIFVGIISKRYEYDLKMPALLIVFVLAELIITGFNTLALYVDSKIFQYYTPGFITAVLALRLGLAAVKGILFSALLPPLMPSIRKAIGR